MAYLQCWAFFLLRMTLPIDRVKLHVARHICEFHKVTAVKTPSY